MQQRYYDPAIGRFLSVDPVTAYSNPVGAFNRYDYAANNPYRFIDPDGRCTGSHIGNKDGTCAFSGDFTTQGRGPTMSGAKTVVQQASIEAQAKFNPRTALAGGDQDDWRAVRYGRQWANGEISNEEYKQLMCPGCNSPFLQKVAIYGLITIGTAGVGTEIYGSGAEVGKACAAIGICASFAQGLWANATGDIAASETFFESQLFEDFLIKEENEAMRDAIRKAAVEKAASP